MLPRYYNKSPITPATALDELVEHVQLKDDLAVASFEEIYRRYYRPILGKVYYIVQHKEEAENICQEVFIAALTKIHQKKKDAPFDRWLHTIALNKAIDHWRHTTKIEMLRYSEEEPEEEDYQTVVPLISTDPGIEERVIDYENVKHLLDKLKPITRQCLILHVLCGLPQKEVADLLDISPKRVHEHIRRAQKPLRHLYPHLQVVKLAKEIDGEGDSSK